MWTNNSERGIYMMKKVIGCAIGAACACAMLASVPSFAYDTYFKDDFENKATGNVTTAYGGTKIIEKDGNKFVAVQDRQEDWNYIYRVTADEDPIKDTDREDSSPEMIIGVDFMVPTNAGDAENTISKFKLMETRWDGTDQGIALWYDNGRIKTGNSGNAYSTSAARYAVVAENIEKDKWYNVFIALDWSEGAKTGEGVPKYSIYMSDNAPISNSFPNGGGSSTFLKRILYSSATRHSSTANSPQDPLYYLDNIKIVNTDDANYELDLALFKARSMAVNAAAGFENGNVPKSIIKRLMNCVDKIEPLIDGAELDASEVSERLDEINAETEIFKGAVIDEINGDSQKTAFVRVNADASMPSQTAAGVNGCKVPLTANAYTQQNSISGGEILWSVKNADGSDLSEENAALVSIVDGESGKELSISGGFTGDLLLIASAARDDGVTFSDTHSINVVTARVLTVKSIISENGEIKIEGSASDTISQDINIVITGNDNDASTADIYKEGTITVNSDKSFVWSTDVPNDEKAQELEIKITGVEIDALSINSYYYGTDWESAVLNAVKNAENNAAIEKILELHNTKLYVDVSLLQAEQNYCTRIMNNKASYDTLDSLQKVIRDTEFVLGFSRASRSEIKSFIDNNNALLKNNGFDIADLNSEDITEAERTSFYVNASVLEFDTLTATVADICSALNKTLEPFKDNNNSSNDNMIDPVTPPAAGGGGGGGGFSGGSKTPSVPSNPTSSEMPFSDVSETDWFYDAVKFMNQKNIMVGDNQKMRPNDTVTRGEFSKIVVVAFGLEANSENIFSDANGKWWKTYAEIAAAHRILKGTDDGIFDGDSAITREMLAVVVDRAVTAKGIQLYDQNGGVTFEDSDYISDWAKESVERLAKKGIVSGIGNNMYVPSLPVTRAEAAQIMYNVLKQL